VVHGAMTANGKEYDLIILLTNKNRAKMRTNEKFTI
jgi:hypothetical protein